MITVEQNKKFVEKVQEELTAVIKQRKELCKISFIFNAVEFEDDAINEFINEIIEEKENELEEDELDTFKEELVEYADEYLREEFKEALAKVTKENDLKEDSYFEGKKAIAYRIDEFGRVEFWESGSHTGNTQSVLVKKDITKYLESAKKLFKEFTKENEELPFEAVQFEFIQNEAENDYDQQVLYDTLTKEVLR